MQKFIRQQPESERVSINYVRPQYHKGYQIPAIPAQEAGIVCRDLWPTRDHKLRIIPGWDVETGEVFRQNINCNEYSEDEDKTVYLSGTFIELPAVQGVGPDRLSFITMYQPGSEDYQRRGMESAAEVFFRNIYRATSPKGSSRFKATPEVQAWGTFGRNMDCAVTTPRPTLLMQCLIFHVNHAEGTPIKPALQDEAGNASPMLAVVALQNSLSIHNLYEALVNPRSKAQPLDAITNNEYGGLAEVDGNILYLNPYSEAPGRNGIARKALRPSVQPKGATGWNPEPYPLDDDIVRSLWVPWDRLLHYMTEEEQLTLLAKEFGADTVNYYVGTDPKFGMDSIPADIAKAGYGRYAKFVGGASTQASPSAQLPRAASVTLPGLPAQAPAAAPATAPLAATRPAMQTGLRTPAAPKTLRATQSETTPMVAPDPVAQQNAAATLSRLRALNGQAQGNVMDMVDDLASEVEGGDEQ